MKGLIAVEQPIGPPLDGPGRFDPSGPVWTQFNSIFSIAIGVLTTVAGVWFLFLLITGAIDYMRAGGDQGKIEDARKRITTAVVGIIVVIAAVFIADFVGYILGFDILNPGGYLLNAGDIIP